MTSTVAEPETQVWPDMEIACEGAVDAPCDRPAAWIMWRACCPDKLKYKLKCTECKDLETSDDCALQCQFCGEVYFPAHRFYTYIEPLK